MKTCRKCNEDKPLEEYPVQKKMRDGRSSWCKQCATSATRDWQVRNKDKVQKIADNWNERNPGLNYERTKLWRKNNPEQTKAHNALRRSRRKKALISDLTPEDWIQILHDSNGKCFYCGDERILQIEHKIPLSRGGNHTKENIVAACAPCNYRKGTKTSEEFCSIIDINEIGE